MTHESSGGDFLGTPFQVLAWSEATATMRPVQGAQPAEGVRFVSYQDQERGAFVDTTVTGSDGGQLVRLGWDLGSRSLVEVEVSGKLSVLDPPLDLPESMVACGTEVTSTLDGGAITAWMEEPEQEVDWVVFPDQVELHLATTGGVDLTGSMVLDSSFGIVRLGLAIVPGTWEIDDLTERASSR